MADRAGQRNCHTATSGRALATLGSRRIGGSQARVALGLVSRLLVLLAIVWAFAGPMNQHAMIAGAAVLPPAESSIRQEAGFAVADGPIASYFAARGGVRTFGPPVSNAFPLMGEQVQIFRDFVLKLDANGSVSTVDLFAMGGIPFRNVGGRIIPDVDQALVSSAPVPGTPDYEARVLELIRTNAPDQWEGKAVGFYKAFAGTVQYEDAFPNGGNRALLTGFAHEVWGMPVSRPVPDAQNPDIVLLRWERGVMAWNSQTGAVTAVPLGETFKTVLTGQGLGPERTAAASGSPFLLQLDAAAPDGVARPGELPNTVLATAFQPGAAAVNAAQLANQYYTPTPTPPGYTGYATPTWTPLPGYQNPYATPTSPYQSSNPTTGYPQPGAYQQPGVTQPGAVPGGGMSGAITSPNTQPGAATGSDPCYGDEQITFAPEQPRVANEVLIAVTSSRPHPYGRLAGTERTQFVRERPGQLGYVWEWTVMLSYPGQHEYTFYVDSTIPCKKIQLTVQEALATQTPKPTKVPTPYGFNNNGNSNNNNGNNNNGNNNNDNNNSGSPPYRDPSQFANVSYDAYNCSTFYSQGEAQRVLRANPSDPNRLDAEDGVQDGIACTTYNNWQYPSDGDYNPVQRTTTSTPTSSTGTAPRINPSNYLGQGDAYNCSSFQSQYNAQSVLRADPSDPNRLDTETNSSANGIACDYYYYSQYPYDTDYNPVGTPQPTNTPTPAGTPTATPTFNPAAYIGQGDRYNCEDFFSQADAQAVLRADPNDPNKLDVGRASNATLPDGVACSSKYDAPGWWDPSSPYYYPFPPPEPRDLVPVSRPTPSTTTRSPSRT